MSAAAVAPVVEIGVGTKAWYRSKKTRAKYLIAQMDQGYVELGLILHELFDVPKNNDRKQLGAYQCWSGISDFGAFCEKKLGLHRRKANRLRNVGRILSVHLAGISPSLRAQAIALGWTKLTELTRIFEHFYDEATVSQWVEIAENSSYVELVRAVQLACQRHGIKNGTLVPDILAETDADEDEDDEEDSYGEDEEASVSLSVGASSGKKRENLEQAAAKPPVERIKRLSFRLLDEQVDNVLEALRRAEELTKHQVAGPIAPSGLLSFICLDFLATNDWGEASDPKMVKRYMNRLEKALGCRLVALRDGDVLFGGKTLAKLLGAYAEEE